MTIQAEIMALLRRLQREMNLSCLFICHDVALVQSFCGRALVMRWGKIVEEGSVDDVIQNPQNEYTIRLIDSVL